MTDTNTFQKATWRPPPKGQKHIQGHPRGLPLGQKRIDGNKTSFVRKLLNNQGFQGEYAQSRPRGGICE